MNMGITTTVEALMIFAIGVLQLRRKRKRNDLYLRLRGETKVQEGCEITLDTNAILSLTREIGQRNVQRSKVTVVRRHPFLAKMCLFVTQNCQVNSFFFGESMLQKIFLGSLSNSQSHHGYFCKTVRDPLFTLGDTFK